MSDHFPNVGEMVWRWPAVVMTVEPDRIVHRFRDGQERSFSLAWADGDADYQAIARWSGYDDHRLYAVQHDLTHHALAHHLRWTRSRAIYHGDPAVPLAEADPVIQWEEHVVGRLARFARTGEPDEFGVIDRLFPDLAASAAELRAVWADPR